jgi:hypothetical protein
VEPEENTRIKTAGQRRIALPGDHDYSVLIKQYGEGNDDHRYSPVVPQLYSGASNPENHPGCCGWRRQSPLDGGRNGRFRAAPS